MADLTNNSAVRNSSATFTFDTCSASQTINASATQDQRWVAIVRNENAAVADQTATVTFAPSDVYMAGVVGTLSVDVGSGNDMKIVGPFESMRFKNSAGKITVAVSCTLGGTATSVKIGTVLLP